MLFAIIILQTCCVQAQEYLRGNNWFVSAADAPIRIQFTPYKVTQILNTVDSIPYPVFTFGGSCISDTMGKLLFACNGFCIYDTNGYGHIPKTIINNPLGDKFFNKYSDGFWDQMSIILPKKNNSYYVFTTGMSDSAYDDWKKPNPPYDFRFDVLSYHVVDMDANANAGKVLSKNNILMKNARLSHNRMTAVRHANGRDWWLVKPHLTEQLFYTFLVKPNNIEGPFEYHSNFSMDSIQKEAGIYGIDGQMVFSPDGNWMASTEAAYKGVFVYKFDRCSGIFNDYHFFALPKDTCYPNVCDYMSGVCFSSDSKFLYGNTYLNVWQIEISDTISTNSLYHIAQIDTDYAYFPWYGNSYLAPNGKIYIGNVNGTQKGMSYIDNPDLKGIDCNYKPKGFRQQFTNLLYPPNMPNYGLGALVGSACDTIRPPVILPVQTSIKIYPNPVGDNLSIELPTGSKKVQVNIYNMLGEIVLSFSSEQIQNDKVELSLKDLARALYSVRINVDGKNYVRKLVKE